MKVQTILVIEDSESDRYIYRRYLQTATEVEWPILEAETLAEGIELWRTRSPTLVLMDVNFPDGSGLELLEIMQESYPESKLPVIMITGQGDAKLVVQAMKLGARDYLFKEDITATLLCRCVVNTLNELALTHKLSRLKQQETIFTQISLHIQQFSNLEEIYQGIVTDIRDFLEADRVIIYQFNPDLSGCIVTESVIPPWTACLSSQIVDTCFQENLGETYRQGQIFSANDIYQANLSDCHLQLLEQFQVRANLVVPILLVPTSEVQAVLWGLLIVHQCSAPRIWQEDDLHLLQRLSVQLAIAVQKSLADQQIKTQLIELRESENRFRQLAENIHQFFYLVDVETSEMLYISPSYETIWGRSCQSLYDNPFSYQENVYFEDVEIVKKFYEDSCSGKATEIEIEYRVVHPDGFLRWVSDRNFPIRNEKGEIYRVCGIAEDITNRKQIELQLAAREAQFQKLAATLPGMLYTLVRKVDGSFFFTYISPIITEIMELEAEAAIADSNLAFELIHPDDLPNYT
ncbi:MAG: GAF domain-containing protein, partial [Microcystaceae cyanobacterium]